MVIEEEHMNLEDPYRLTDILKQNQGKWMTVKDISQEHNKNQKKKLAFQTIRNHLRIISTRNSAINKIKRRKLNKIMYYQYEEQPYKYPY